MIGLRSCWAFVVKPFVTCNGLVIPFRLSQLGPKRPVLENTSLIFFFFRSTNLVGRIIRFFRKKVVDTPILMLDLDQGGPVTIVT